MTIVIRLRDAGNGLAGPGELALCPPTGTTFRVSLLIGPIIAVRPSGAEQLALADIVDDDGEPVCTAAVETPQRTVLTVGGREMP